MGKSSFSFKKQSVEVSSLKEADLGSDVAYWRSRPAEERFAAVEFLRQQFYDYDPATARVSRVLEIVERDAV